MRDSDKVVIMTGDADRKTVEALEDAGYEIAKLSDVIPVVMPNPRIEHMIAARGLENKGQDWKGRGKRKKVMK